MNGIEELYQPHMETSFKCKTNELTVQNDISISLLLVNGIEELYQPHMEISFKCTTKEVTVLSEVRHFFSTKYIHKHVVISTCLMFIGQETQ